MKTSLSIKEKQGSASSTIVSGFHVGIVVPYLSIIKLSSSTVND